MKKGIGIIIGVIAIIASLSIGFGIGYMCNEVVGDKEPTTEKKEPIIDDTGVKKNLKLDDPVVIKLIDNMQIGSIIGDSYGAGYSWINYFIIKGESNILYKNDFSNGFINYLGYKQLDESKIIKVSCDDYPEMLNNRLCGSFNADGSIDKIVDSFDESDLKNEVEEIFGKGSYEESDIYTLASYDYEYSGDKIYIGYSYDEKSKKYLYKHSDAGDGGYGSKHDYKLDSAYKLDNYLYIIVKANKKETSTSDIKSYNIEFKFELVDGNYIFKSVSKNEI